MAGIDWDSSMTVTACFNSRPAFTSPPRLADTAFVNANLDPNPNPQFITASLSLSPFRSPRDLPKVVLGSGDTFTLAVFLNDFGVVGAGGWGRIVHVPEGIYPVDGFGAFAHGVGALYRDGLHVARVGRLAHARLVAELRGRQVKEGR